MDLITYLRTLPYGGRRVFAEACGTTVGRLNNVAYGAPCGAKLAAAIERESGGRVTRQQMRPHDWQDIWPELSRQPVAA